MRYQNFKDLLEKNTQAAADRTVFLYDADGIQKMTWSQFDIAVHIRIMELQNDHCTCIGILCENTPACMIELFAGVMSGKQIVLLDASASSELLKQQIQATDVDSLWGSTERVHELQDALTAGCTDGAGQILFFTSGTTSKAKAVVLSDASLMASAWNGSSLLPLDQDDILLDILPLHHVFGMVCGLLWGMSSQAPVALGRGPRHYLDDCQYFHPTVVSLVPMLLAYLLKYDQFNPELHTILIGAGDCPEEYFTASQAKGLRVCYGYGLSETSSGVALSTGQDSYAMDLCPDVTVSFENDGEICLKVPSCMMRGYYHDLSSTQAVLQDDVLHTGDLGFMDMTGKLHVIGRKKEMLVLLDGTKIFLPEYERPLKELFGTDELAVVLYNHMPVLVCDDLHESDETVLEKAEMRLKDEPRGHQLTAVISLHHTLPRTATGKIKHWEIQKEVQETWQKEKKY